MPAWFLKLKERKEADNTGKQRPESLGFPSLFHLCIHVRSQRGRLSEGTFTYVFTQKTGRPDLLRFLLHCYSRGTQFAWEGGDLQNPERTGRNHTAPSFV